MLRLYLAWPGDTRGENTVELMTGLWSRKSQLDVIQSKEEEKQIKSCSPERTLTASELAPSSRVSQGPAVGLWTIDWFSGLSKRLTSGEYQQLSRRLISFNLSARRARGRECWVVENDGHIIVITLAGLAGLLDITIIIIVGRVSRCPATQKFSLRAITTTHHYCRPPLVEEKLYNSIRNLRVFFLQSQGSENILELLPVEIKVTFLL